MKKVKVKRPPADLSAEILGRRVCGNCDHWGRSPDEDQEPGEDIVGECLWKPPVVLALNEAGQVVQASPIRNFHDRCGQHQPKVN